MKKKLALLFIIVLLFHAITGCASMINAEMEPWNGRSMNDLVASWGPPSQIMSDGQGGQILIYSIDRTWVTPGQATTNTYENANIYGNTYNNTYSGNIYGTARSTTDYTPPQTNGYIALRMFWVDGSGRIYRWSWKGF